MQITKIMLSPQCFINEEPFPTLVSLWNSSILPMKLYLGFQVKIRVNFLKNNNKKKIDIVGIENVHRWDVKDMRK